MWRIQPKKRRTGKPAPIQEKINFDKYFSAWISDLGITYRSWFQSHKSTTVIVRGVTFCKLGSWSDWCQKIANACWPEDCPGCTHVFEQARVSQKDLVEGVQKLHQQVVGDLTAYSKLLEEPKAKRARSVQADSGEVTVKQEPALDYGPGQCSEGPREELLDKNGLIDLHNLKKLENGAYGKKISVVLLLLQQSILR